MPWFGVLPLSAPTFEAQEGDLSVVVYGRGGSVSAFYSPYTDFRIEATENLHLVDTVTARRGLDASVTETLHVSEGPPATLLNPLRVSVTETLHISDPITPPTLTAAQVFYYVDDERTSNGSGSETSPWKLRSDINWTTIATSCATSAVTIYFSSRAAWTNTSYLDIPANTNTAGHTLTLDGQSKYNTVTSGTAVWQAETNPSNLATLDQTVIIRQDLNSFITFRGFRIIGAASGGIALGTSEVALVENLHDILIENNVVDTPADNIGIGGVYLEAGCYNITIRNNTIIETPTESIYVGHYNFLTPSVTGVVIENNTIIDCGTAVEGDIDIKAPCFGAIIRYNTMYCTTLGQGLGGVVIQSSDCQIYGNKFFDLRYRPADPDNGGVHINADGDGVTGITIANTLVYNNLIYGGQLEGITMHATETTSLISNLKILNNTIVGNAQAGIRSAASGVATITVSELHNNIIANNGTRALNFIGSGDIITAANHNLIFGAGTLITYQGVSKNWGQWQALGFDAQGVNEDPDLDANYVPNVGSPAIGAGSTQTEFTIDKNGTTRTVPWDIGCFETS